MALTAITPHNEDVDNFFPLPSKELSESIHANSLSASASVVEKAIGALINKAIARKVTCRGAKSFIKSFSREL
jgi:hypothetical protein